MSFPDDFPLDPDPQDGFASSIDDIGAEAAEDRRRTPQKRRSSGMHVVTEEGEREGVRLSETNFFKRIQALDPTFATRFQAASHDGEMVGETPEATTLASVVSTSNATASDGYGDASDDYGPDDCSLAEEIILDLEDPNGEDVDEDDEVVECFTSDDDEEDEELED